MTFTCQTCNVERVSLDCGPCMAVKLGELCAKEKKRADEAEAKLAHAVEVLGELEYIDNSGSCYLYEYCPYCDTEPPAPHDADCRLAALIGKAGA